MEIFIVPPEQSVGLKEEQKKPPSRRLKRKKDRRRAHKDRRQSVNEGLVVRLSTKKDRRRSFQERRGVGGRDAAGQANASKHQPQTRFQVRV